MEATPISPLSPYHSHMPTEEQDPTLAVDLHDVRKVYRGRIEALRGIKMQARRGEVFGLLGPNGAGKSTLVKIMLTVVRPTKAMGTILGERIGNRAALRKMGYLPEKHRFPEYLTGRQAIELSGALNKVPRARRKIRASELLEVVGMSDWGDRKVGSYSKGMLQRVGIAGAMVNDPELVVLDEPTDGVDPVGRRDIRDVLENIRARGTCVFLNSHLLSELELVCDRVALLVQGEVAAQGTIDDLTRDSRRYELRIVGPPPTWAEESGIDLKVDEGVGTLLVLPQAEAADAQTIVDRLRKESRVILSMVPVRESLEDLFMRFVKDPETGKARLPGAARNTTPTKAVS